MKERVASFLVPLLIAGVLLYQVLSSLRIAVTHGATLLIIGITLAIAGGLLASGTFEVGYYLSKLPKAEQTEKRRKSYEGYFAQLRCVQSKLDDFMTAVGQSENYRDAVIIVHGDHGSRISSGNVLEDYTRRDYVDNYATFFAVRSPAAAAGVDCEFVSLPEVFRRYVAPRVDPRPRTGPPLPVLVISRYADNELVEARMPLFGCAARPAAPGP